MTPIQHMRLDDMIADLDEVGDYLIGRCEAGDNNELDHLGAMADAIATAAKLLWSIKYDL
jgi:hypothetical protein